MPNYEVTTKIVYSEVIRVEAEDADQAADRAESGEGKLIDSRREGPFPGAGVSTRRI